MPQEFVVQPGGSAQLTVNLDSARAILEAVDVDPLLLPDSLDGAVVSAELYDALFLDYGAVQLLQTPVPDVNYPDDVDPTVIGEAALRFLGMDDDEAYRLAHNIDWTNTLGHACAAGTGYGLVFRVGRHEPALPSKHSTLTAA